jgi:protein TonB
MIYADLHPGRYAPPSRFSPQGLGGALILTGAVITAMTFVAPQIGRIVRDGPLVIESYPLPKPPPPDPQPKPKPQPRAAIRAEKPFVPKPDVPTPPSTDTHIDFTPTQPPAGGDPKGTGDIVAPPADPPALPFIGADMDPHYAGAFQPPYPPSEQRADHEGTAVVRVLIGVDGRVRQVERVSATSDAFYAATERQALAKWRFKPATRGGVPEAQWKTMRVRFVLNDG